MSGDYSSFPSLGIEVGTRGTDSPLTTVDSIAWLNASEDVEMQNNVVIDFGRQNEINQADPNTCALTFEASEFKVDASGTYAKLAPSTAKIGIGVPLRASVNLCQHGNSGTFEADATGWSGVNATVARTTAQAHSGSGSLQVTATSAASISGNTPSGTSGIPVAPSTEYRASAWVRTAVTGRAADMRIDWYTAAGALISTSNGPDVTDSTTWQQITLTATSPATAAFARIRPLWVGAAIGEVHYLDDVRLDCARFTGYISSVTPIWPSGNMDTGLRVQVRAESRLAWLGRAKALQDRTSVAIIGSGATSYWPTSDAVKANDGTAKSSPPWHTFDNQPRIWIRRRDMPENSGAFGKAPDEEWGTSPDGLKVASFRSGQYGLPAGGVGIFESRRAAAQVETIPKITSTAAWSVAIIARLGRTERTETGQFKIIRLRNKSGFSTPPETSTGLEEGVIEFGWFSTGGSPEWIVTAVQPWTGALPAPTNSGSSAAPAIRDREWHLFTMTSTGGATPTLRIYYDGTLIRTLSVTNGGFELNSISVGEYLASYDGEAAPDLRHEFGRLAIWNGTRLTDSQVATLYEDVVNQSGEGDTVTERLQRWAGYAGFPTSQLTITSPGDTPLLPQSPVGSALQLMQDVAATDGGVLFDRRSGNTRYLGPDVRRTASTAAVTLDATVSEPGDLGVSVDTTEIVNEITIKAADESATVVRQDAASIALHGHFAQELTMVTDSQAYLTARADWLLHRNSNPRPRVPSLNVALTALSAAKQVQLLSETFEPGSMVAVAGLPSAVNGLPTNYFLEGASETWGPGTCDMTLYVSDTTVEASTFILDDATRGVLNSAYVLG